VANLAAPPPALHAREPVSEQDATLSILPERVAHNQQENAEGLGDEREPLGGHGQRGRQEEGGGLKWAWLSRWSGKTQCEEKSGALGSRTACLQLHEVREQVEEAHAAMAN
jgi:hypothetical protein